MNTFEIIDLNEQIIYKGIAKYTRHKVEALSPMSAVQSLFPDLKVSIDRHGMGNIVVFSTVHQQRGDCEACHTFNVA